MFLKEEKYKTQCVVLKLVYILCEHFRFNISSFDINIYFSITD